MRFGDLQPKVLLEREFTARERQQQGQGLVDMSFADLYDLLGQPYPLTDKGTVPEGWWTKQTFAVGEDEGMLNPQLAGALQLWRQGGMVPGELFDPESGKLVPYNDNPYLLDTAYAVVSGLATWVSDINAGAAFGADKLGQFVGVTDQYNLTRSAASGTWIDDFADWMESNTDLDYRDRQELMANAISEPGDLLGLLNGQAGRDINWQGFGAMLATELPSEIINIAIMAKAGPAGIVAGAALNAAEATGSAAKEIFSSIQFLYDDGQLQKTYQWQAATIMAEEGLKAQGVVPGSADYNDRLETLALNIIQDNTLNSQMLGSVTNMEGIAASGAILDTAADLLVFKRLGGSVIKTAMARILMTPAMEGFDEALQQKLINDGLIDEAGDPRDDWAGVLNAGYQGVVIGGAVGGAAGTAELARGANAERKAAQAALRQYFFGKDANNIEIVFDILNADPALLINRITDPETGKLNFRSLVDTTIPIVDDLTNSEKRRLSRNGTITRNGKKYTTDQINIASRNVALLGILDNASYDANNNSWSATFGSEQDITDLLQMLGVENAQDLGINEQLRIIEETIKLDMRVQDRSDLEAPKWSELNAVQRQEYINNGYISTFEKTDSIRQGQTWSREDVLRTSQREGDNVPDNILNLPDNVDARPQMPVNDKQRIDDINQAIENNTVYQNAKRQLAADQAAFDEEFGATHNPDGTAKVAGEEDLDFARPSADDEGDPYNFGGARASVSTLEAEKKQIQRRLSMQQAVWDRQYYQTHDRNGVAKVNPIQPVPSVVTQDDEKTDDEKTDDETTDDSTGPKVQTEVVIPTAPPGGSDIARQTIEYNLRIRVANGDMDPLSVRSMFAELEKTYPGITNNVLGEDGIEGYVQDPTVREKQLETEAPVLPLPVAPNRPPTGTEIEYEGETYRWLGIEAGTGGMWAKVKEDGTRGTTNHQNHNNLMTAWQDTLGDVEKTEAQPEVIVTPPGEIELPKPEVTTTGPTQPEVQEPEVQEPEEPGPEEPFDTPEEPSTIPEPEPEVTDPEIKITDPGDDTEVQDPGDDTEVQEPEVQEPDIFDPTAKTPIDDQFADVEVPQSVRDEYAEVVATNNSIKIMQFLDSLPQYQAAKLRYDGIDKDEIKKDDDTTDTTDTTDDDTLPPGTFNPFKDTEANPEIKIKDPEVQDPEVQDPEVTEPEVQEPEVKEPEPEVQEPEPEVQEPEVKEPEPEVQEPEPEVQEPEPEVQEPEPEVKPELEPELEPKVEPTSPRTLPPTIEPKIKLTPPKIEPQLQPEVKPEVKPEVELEPEVEPKVEPEPELEPKVEPEPEVELEPEVEPKVEPEPEVELEPEPEIEIDTELNPTIVPKINTNIDTKLNTNPAIKTNTDSKKKVKPKMRLGLDKPVTLPKYTPLQVKDPEDLRRYTRVK